MFGQVVRLVLFLFVAVPAFGQPSRFPHDPALLQKLNSGQFDKIGTSGSDKLGLNAVVMAFTHGGCQLKNANVSMARAAEYTRYLTSDAEANLTGALFIKAHPLYAETLMRASQTGGCDGVWAQTTMANLFRYLDSITSGKSVRPVPAERALPQPGEKPAPPGRQGAAPTNRPADDCAYQKEELRRFDQRVAQSKYPIPAVRQQRAIHEARIAEACNKSGSKQAAKTSKPVPSTRATQARYPLGEYTTNQTVIVRGGPGLQFDEVARLTSGITVTVVGSEASWLRIQSKHGRSPGYIPATAAQHNRTRLK